MKKIVWGIFLILLFLLSYSREVLFLSINSILSGDTTFYAKTIRIPWLIEQSNDFLLKAKYVLTVGYTIVFALTTILGLRFSFTNKFPQQLALLVYVLIFLCAAIALTIVGISGTFNTAYPYFRLAIGYIHNPLFYLFLSLTFFVHKSLVKNS